MEQCVQRPTKLFKNLRSLRISQSALNGNYPACINNRERDQRLTESVFLPQQLLSRHLFISWLYPLKKVNNPLHELSPLSFIERR